MNKDETKVAIQEQISEYMSNNYVRITMRTSTPKKTITSTQLKERVATMENADPELLSGSIKLRSKTGELAKIDRAIANANAYVTSQLEPYSVKRVRSSKDGILHVDRLEDFIIQMKQFENQREQVREDLRPQYDHLVAEQIRRLGSAAYDLDLPSLYPDFDSWFDQSSVTYDIEQLASYSLDKATTQAARASVTAVLKQQEQRMDNLLSNAMQRATEVIEQALRCSQPGVLDSGRKRPIHENLPDKMAEIAQAFRGFNVYKNPQIDKLCDQLEDASNFNVEDAREHDDVRAELHKKMVQAAATTQQLSELPLPEHEPKLEPKPEPKPVTMPEPDPAFHPTPDVDFDFGW